MSSISPAAAPTVGGADAAPAPTAAAAASSTFWCYECDMSVAVVFSSAPPLVCPYCRGDFLEEMDEPTHLPPHFDHAGPGGLDDPDDPTAVEDYYEVFDRLISHIVSSASDDQDNSAVGGVGGPRPASRSSVEAIPTVRITDSFLAADPFLLCAVCKDEFVVQTEARRLPCGHIYHPDCILPWLSLHNSCPVCRFQLPTEEEERRRLPARVDRSAVVFGNLLDLEQEVDRDVREIHSMLRSVFPGDADAPAEAEDDLLDIGGILRRIARRRRFLFSRRSRLSVAAASSPAQLAQADVASQGLADNPGSVSTTFPLDEVASAGGSGTGAGVRVDEEVDVVMSEAVASGLCN